ncbi:MAG: 16S rRNA (guanine(966)-N(2))-methyltransferase RsmD [Candidatus Omnitrophica bacterium]|nr:16S rRNA (guanine(966)-N(2))-methyltransferase RsmD [Candidatus Omnitrophota bacterium]
MIRVAAGALRGLMLTAPKHIRPTESKVRQALFNIVGEAVQGAVVVEVCAGSGALGIEALSRGAKLAVFLEAHPVCVRALERNLAQIPSGRIEGTWEVLPGDAFRTLPLLGRRGVQADLVLLDPPYDEETGKKALNAVAACGILTPTSLLCLEHPRWGALPPTVGSLARVKQHRYGETVLSFYQPTP